MNIKAKGTVTIPKAPRSLMGLIPWAKSVNSSIQQLRDRTWTVPNGGGTGSGSSVAVPPLSIVSSKPSYIPAPTESVEAGHKRFFLTWGFVNGILAENWQLPIDVPSGTEGTQYLFLKAYIAPGDTSSLKITSWEWLLGTESDEYETPEWPSATTRPDYFVASLGAFHIASDGAVTPISSGGGSIQVSELIFSIDTSAAPAVVFRKTLSHLRLNY